MAFQRSKPHGLLDGGRTDKNGWLALVGMLRQAVFGRLAGYDDVTTPRACAMIRRCAETSTEKLV